MNKAASDLGKLAKGVKKTLSLAERKKRAARMRKAQKKRWEGHEKK